MTSAIKSKNLIAVASKIFVQVALFWCFAMPTFAQSGSLHVTATVDAQKITVGDQLRLFIQAPADPSATLHWAQIPDSFDHLEVVERGKIDTIKQGTNTIYKQRLVITGFDSGLFRIPSFLFTYSGQGGNNISVGTDTFQVLVQTVAVDTTQAFKPIKGIMAVKGTWLDYIWYIIGAILLFIVGGIVAWYFIKNKKVEIPKPTGPVETLQQRTLRLLAELDAQQLWQKKQVKEYYVQLTDIVRGYIEQRFNTPAMELTTDDILYKAQYHRELQPYHSLLANLLTTADLAKFAKAQPLPQEHVDAMEKAKQFVITSKPVDIQETPTATEPKG